MIKITLLLRTSFKLLIFVFFGSSVLFAQENRIEQTGNVGIGTVDPNTTLEVNGSSYFSGGDFKIFLDDDYDAVEIDSYNGVILKGGDGGQINLGTETASLSGREGGRLGITSDSSYLRSSASSINVENTGIDMSTREGGIVFDSFNGFYFEAGGSDHASNITFELNASDFEDDEDTSDVVFNIERGNAEFNATSLTVNSTAPEGYDFSVGGKGIMEELKIALQNTDAWPDYVFENDYKLPSLKSVENYIKKKGHLKEMPSAKEIAKEEGFMVGALNVKLLKKIEELTLYTIAQEKQLEKQAREIEALKAQNTIHKNLEARLLKVEKLLAK